mgnify:CR=1 FL=1
MGQMIALRHGRNDIQAFEKVMTLSKAEIIDNPEPASRIIGAFNYFVEHIDESKLDIMTIFVNTQFVRIDLDADEDEQQIFDTINSLGVNLTTSELLKNYFSIERLLANMKENGQMYLKKMMRLKYIGIGKLRQDE